MIKLAVSGCCGKMSSRIIALSFGAADLKLVAAVETKNHPSLGKNLSEILNIPNLDVLVRDNFEAMKEADVLIEFTSPAASIEHLEIARQYHKAMVIGTTGLSKDQVGQIKKVAKDIPIVYSPNMSIGVNLVFRLVKQTAQKLSSQYQVDIREAHHVHKKDAPSGTAKHLAELIKMSPDRDNLEIKIDSIREDEIVGDHQVCFDGPQDTIVISHSAKTRDIFAQGALAAARFIVKQKEGLYDMQDVLG